MKITALAPWFGSKRTLAPRIVEELGPHTCYWELCAGSMAVLLAKPQCSMETVVDLHGDLVNLARVVASTDDGPRLYRRLRRTMLADAIHAEAKQRLAEPFEPGVDRAYWYFLASWLGMNGVAGTKRYNNSFATRYTASGGHAAKRFCSAVDSIPAWRQRMRNLTILQRDLFTVVDQIRDEAGTAIYIDPPYLVKGAKYEHDFEDEHHVQLAESLRRFQAARVVVSYYEDPRLDDLYSGWTKLDCSMTKSLAQQGRRDRVGRTVAPEILLLNGESNTAPAGRLFA